MKTFGVVGEDFVNKIKPPHCFLHVLTSASIVAYVGDEIS
jgi:hypothetical protein